MSRVEIQAGGRNIAVEHAGDLEQLARIARELWDHTATVTDPPGPPAAATLGFSVERAEEYRSPRWTDTGTPEAHLGGIDG